MIFNLKKPLCFFDLEATGLNVIRDRIVQIAVVKMHPDGREETLEMLINPGVPMSAEAIAVHGIQPKDLRNKPSFREVAEEIFDFIGDSDLAGYNSNGFDVPMLLEEFHRAGLEFDLKKRRLVDAAQIFYKMEPRTLRAALKYYTGKTIENAHDALSDVRATIDVLRGQIEKYDGVEYEDSEGNKQGYRVVNDVQKLHEFTTQDQYVDVTRRLKRDAEGQVVFNFGKYNGRRAKDILRSDRHYFKWIMDKDFSVQVKTAIREIMQEIKNE